MFAGLPRESSSLGICRVKHAEEGLEVGPEGTQDAAKISCFFKMTLLLKGSGLGFDPCSVGFLTALDLGVVFVFQRGESSDGLVLPGI